MEIELREKIDALERKHAFISSVDEQIRAMNDFVKELKGARVWLSYGSSGNRIVKCSLSPKRSEEILKIVTEEIKQCEELIVNKFAEG